MAETGYAHAKINLSLDIVSRMPDGYHDMKMVMQTVSLRDVVTIICIPGEGTAVDSGLSYLPGDEKNIAAEAAAVFYDHTGVTGYHTWIGIKKEIPVCAGMGGGSADGACVLRMLDGMHDTKLGFEALEKIGAAVGSDVPFCIRGGTALAEGRGETLTRLPPIPQCHIVICKPPFTCPTPEAFARVRCGKIRARPDTAGMIDAIGEGDLRGVARRVYNVFEGFMDFGKREVADIKNTLSESGALGTSMTGSGPAVYGLFGDKGDALKAYERLNTLYAECYLTETVNLEW